MEFYIYKFKIIFNIIAEMTTKKGNMNHK